MNNSNDKFKKLLIIFVALFIFVFFTREYYSSLVENMDINEQKKLEYKQKIEKANDLQKIKNDFKSWKQNKYSKDIKKYSQKISEDKIISEIYSAAENKINWDVKITSLSMSKWVKNELGFYESKLNITAIVKDKETIKDLFNYLNNNPKYKIFINSFNMPKTPTPIGYKITIPATIFYASIK